MHRKMHKQKTKRSKSMIHAYIKTLCVIYRKKKRCIFYRKKDTMKKRQKSSKHKIAIMAALVLALACIAGVSFAWFSSPNNLNSVSVVQVPSKISISGANRSEMQRISLELTGDDEQEGNQVTIRRVFCIESTDDYLLEIARTTNISDMDIRIFPVSNENSESDKTTGKVQGVDSEAGRVFYYDPDSEPLAGAYLNRDAGKAETVADTSLHDNSYASGEENMVHQNAEALYWLTSNAEECAKENYSREGVASDGETQIHYRYYVLELTWSVESSETDIVYLLASHKE